MKKRKLMLCPVDFSPASYEAVEKASFLARLFQAELTLLHVIQVLPQTFGVLREADPASHQLLENARNQARDLMRAAKQKYIPYVVPSKSVVRSGAWATEILAETRELGADLLILPAKGAVFSQDIDRLVREASCPILAYQQAESGDVSVRKGFKKILVPVYGHTRGGEVLGYLTRYLSMMSPELVLVDMTGQNDGENVEVLRYEAALKDAGLRATKRSLKAGKFKEQVLQEMAGEEGCDLILMAPEISLKPGRGRDKRPAGNIPFMAWGPSHNRETSTMN